MGMMKCFWRPVARVFSDGFDGFAAECDEEVLTDENMAVQIAAEVISKIDKRLEKKRVFTVQDFSDLNLMMVSFGDICSSDVLYKVITILRDEYKCEVDDDVEEALNAIAASEAKIEAMEAEASNDDENNMALTA